MFTTILIPLNIKNTNDRIYTREMLEPQVNKFINGTYGELYQPSNVIINLTNVSHTIHNLRFTNKNLIGDIKILKTKKGKQLQWLLDSGIELVFRPRSIGFIDNDYAMVEKIITFDAIPLNEDSFFNTLQEQRRRKLKILSKISEK